MLDGADEDREQAHGNHDQDRGLAEGRLSPQKPGAPFRTRSSVSFIPLERQFWMRPASSLTWQIVQGYSTAATYRWDSAGAAAGTVYFGVWVKDPTSSAAYDALNSTSVTVT